MPSTYSNLKIQLMATGENTTTWGSVTNLNLGTALEEAIVGSADITFTSNNQTLVLTDTNASQPARNMRLRCTGTTGGSTRELVVPSIEKPYIVKNDCADPITVKTAAGSGVTIPAGTSTWVYSDGVDVVDVVSTLSVANGGTGGTSAATARVNLGAAASGVNTDITTLNPSGGLQVGAPTGGAQGNGTINAAGLFINGQAVGTSNAVGTVTNVTMNTSTTGLTVNGGTTASINSSGTFTIAGTLAVANGGTGINTLTNNAVLVGNATSTVKSVSPGTTGNVLTSNGSAWVSQAGGSGTGVNNITFGTTGLTPATATNGNVTVAGTLVVANGGTGTNTYTNGQLLIGNTTGNTLTKATLTAGSGISITNGAGSITIAASGGGGTVTSVNGAGGTTGLTLTGGPITTSGTLTLGGTLAVANGGTGANTASAAATALGLGTGSNVQHNSLGIGTAASGTAGEIRATNNITAYYSSDIRFKENIADIQGALDAVQHIGGKTFDWTDEYIADHGGADGYFVRKRDFGVIAQDVQGVFPLAVREREDGTLAVDYDKLCALAFGAIKELRAEVAELRQQIIKVVKP